MKKIFIFSVIFATLSFTVFQKNNFTGNWNIVDSYNIEQVSLKNLALHDVVKKKIVEQKSQIIFSTDNIMIKQNDIITDKSKVRELKNITNDSIVFKFDDHTASFKLKNDKSGVITVDKKAVFVVEK